jgi:hypothetical protein
MAIPPPIPRQIHFILGFTSEIAFGLILIEIIISNIELARDAHNFSYSLHS